MNSSSMALGSTVRSSRASYAGSLALMPSASLPNTTCDRSLWIPVAAALTRRRESEATKSRLYVRLPLYALWSLWSHLMGFCNLTAEYRRCSLI